MRKFTFKGITTYFTEKEYKDLLSRWDKSQITFNKDEQYYEINKDCELCNSYYTSVGRCTSCPANVFDPAKDPEDHVQGCTDLLQAIRGKDNRVLVAGAEIIYWRKKANVDGRKAVQKVRDALLTATKVSRRVK